MNTNIVTLDQDSAAEEYTKTPEADTPPTPPSATTKHEPPPSPSTTATRSPSKATKAAWEA